MISDSATTDIAQTLLPLRGPGVSVRIVS